MGRKKKVEEAPVQDERVSKRNYELTSRNCSNCFERMIVDNDYVCPTRVVAIDEWKDRSSVCVFYMREPLAMTMVNGVAEYSRIYETPQEKLRLYVQYCCHVRQ